MWRSKVRTILRRVDVPRFSISKACSDTCRICSKIPDILQADRKVVKTVARSMFDTPGNTLVRNVDMPHTGQVRKSASAALSDQPALFLQELRILKIGAQHILSGLADKRSAAWHHHDSPQVGAERGTNCTAGARCLFWRRSITRPQLGGVVPLVLLQTVRKVAETALRAAELERKEAEDGHVSAVVSDPALVLVEI